MRLFARPDVAEWTDWPVELWKYNNVVSKVRKSEREITLRPLPFVFEIRVATLSHCLWLGVTYLPSKRLMRVAALAHSMSAHTTTGAGNKVHRWSRPVTMVGSLVEAHAVRP